MMTEAPVGRWRRRAPRRPGAARYVAAAILLLALDALWLEPKVLLVPQTVRLASGTPAREGRLLRVAHLSDLHLSEETWQLRRLLGQVAAARPDAILVSGDWIRDVPEEDLLAGHAAAAAAFARELRRIAPIYSVQGHSEYQGIVLAALEGAGVTWLSNRGVRIGPYGASSSALLLGLNQQVGEDAYVPHWHPPFRVVEWQGNPAYGAVRGLPDKDFYSHYDPAPAWLIDERGPLSWSGYEVLCDTLIDSADAGAGIAVHSRYVVGEDRMIRLRRVKAEEGRPGTFFLLAQGSTLTGRPDTGIDPEPGRWYRLRLKTVALPDRVLVFARVWPAGTPEPAQWQAWGEDRSPRRAVAGTVGLGAWGGGTVLYRNLRVTANDGRVLLADPLTEPAGPAGFRQGTRGTRLALALARSPEVPPDTPRIVLSHSPDVAPEASRRGIEIVLAGHTHGGQVRLPFVGALLTRTQIGPAFDRGLFEWAAPNRRGWTWLYVNPGVGTSLFPIRFWDPPGWAEVEIEG